LRQMTLLPTADICTIDSFCAKVVKDNFAAADVEVDFAMMDDKDTAEITAKALEAVIEALYEENSPEFNLLNSMFLSERDDGALGEIITTLYEYSRSYPNPWMWLDSVCEEFDEELHPSQTAWATVLFKYVSMLADFHYKRLMRCVALMEDSGNFSSDYLLRFNSTAERLNTLRNAASDKNWDGMVTIIREGVINKVAARNYKVDENLKKLTQEAFDELEKDFESLTKHTLPLSGEHKADCRLLHPVVSKLCESVKMLTREMDALKKENNAYSFDDVLHKCIGLLVEFRPEGWVRTPLAEEMRNKYREILIDEYQDTNDAQNIIFEALSKNKQNLYVVGDVKQSIYRFRLASPELFMGLRRNLPDYDGGIHPSQVTLDSNFRSRKGIDEAVNYIFKALMSLEVGEIDYNDREALTFGAEWYPEKNTPDTEIICLDCEGLKSKEATMAEAECVAAYIKRILASGVTVTTKTGERPVRSSDICVLLRSLKDKVDYYVEALKEYGIAANAVIDGDTSESKEIRVLVSLIKTINNPLVDIPLIAVMLSPVFGFTVDELSKIRLVNTKAELFTCLQKYAETDEKSREFLKKIDLYRNVAASYPVDEFVDFLLTDTAFDAIYSSVDGGERRVNNLRGFQKLARDFTANGRKGLGSFVRYVDNAIKNGSLRSGNSSGYEGVQFMSIHKSKGLEFPYVIIADCSKGFNKRDSYSSLTLARETGMGLKIRDDERFTKYHTVSSAGTEKAILFGSASEELRVLYVAMTRAKEHLTFVCSISGKQLPKRIKLNNVLSLDSDGKVHPYGVFRANSISEWVLTAFARHKNCEIIRDVAEYTTEHFNGDSFGVDVSYVTEGDYSFVEVAEQMQAACEPDEEILSELEGKLCYEYPYECQGILAKRTASSTEVHEKNREYFANSKPDFLKKSFSGADRGTAIHKFLELCDFAKAGESVSQEKDRLFTEGVLTEKEAAVLDDSSLERFFKSDIGERLLAADCVFKEYEFAFLMKAGELYPDAPESVRDEEVVVQGKADCAFLENGKLVLIDYKSDNVTDSEVFKVRYKPQIDIYSRALTECTGYPVTERYLYSFKLNSFIEV
ncbi:MAG: UvrD-helicase domain-containing protein, partial [Clostridia bacterium]|nr:UvrD-helicase domain-containing protein [Clostridia bacterium]